MKASKTIKTVLLSSPLFLAGCYHDPYYERIQADGVPVVYTAQPHYHYSSFYGGYVPIIVPIGGFGGGMNYHTYYNTLPPAQRARYAAPIRSSPRATPSSSVPKATPTNSSSVSPKASPTTTTHTAPSSGTTRGIAGGHSVGSASS